MAEALTFVFWIIGVTLTIVTLPGTLELALLTLGALLPRRKQTAALLPKKIGKIAVIVPAHNEETIITATLRSIQSCEGDFDLYVIADNCIDDTVNKVKESHIAVLERNNLDKKGKGYALDEAFNRLFSKGYDYFIVIDADSYISRNCITDMKQVLESGADAVQIRYGVHNPESSWRSRLMHIAFMAFGHLRTRGRVRLGFSAGIHGNGFGLTRKTLEAVPYRVVSLVEDVAYHLELVKAGRKVVYLESSKVLSDMPLSGAVAEGQRTRWEGGRLRLLLDEAPTLFKRILKGDFRLMEPLLDLLCLPLAYHCFLLLVLLVFPSFQGYAFFALMIVGFHVMLALIVGGGTYKDFLALLTAPFYILWKLLIILKIVKASDTKTEWIRTKRDNH